MASPVTRLDFAPAIAMQAEGEGGAAPPPPPPPAEPAGQCAELAPGLTKDEVLAIRECRAAVKQQEEERKPKKPPAPDSRFMECRGFQCPVGRVSWIGRVANPGSSGTRIWTNDIDVANAPNYNYNPGLSAKGIAASLHFKQNLGPAKSYVPSVLWGAQFMWDEHDLTLDGSDKRPPLTDSKLIQRQWDIGAMAGLSQPLPFEMFPAVDLVVNVPIGGQAIYESEVNSQTQAEGILISGTAPERDAEGDAVGNPAVEGVNRTIVRWVPGFDVTASGSLNNVLLISAAYGFRRGGSYTQDFGEADRLTERGVTEIPEERENTTDAEVHMPNDHRIMLGLGVQLDGKWIGKLAEWMRN